MIFILYRKTSKFISTIALLYFGTKNWWRKIYFFNLEIFRQAKELGEKMLKIEAKLNVLISTLSTPHDIFKILRAFEIQNLKIRTVIFEIYWTRFPTV